MDLNSYEYANGLARLISLKTITDTNEEEFTRLHELLKEMFPKVFSIGELHEFGKTLYVLIKGKSSKNPIMFMNHHDVVETSGDWKHEPFGVTIEDNIIYGRGTVDTKSGLFCMFQAMEEILEEHDLPDNDVYLLSTADEENYGNGAKEVADRFEKNGIKFKYILDEGGLVVPNPLGGNGLFAMISTGEKAIMELKISASGNGGHSGSPMKNSPLVRISKFISELEETRKFKKRLNKTIVQTFKSFAKGSTGLKRFIFNHPRLFSPILKIVSSEVPTLNAMFRTTTAFTMIKGSDQANVIPSAASVVINVRIAPHDSVEYAYNVVEKLCKKYNLQYETITPAVDNNISQFNTQEFARMKAILNNQYNGITVSPYISNTASDSRFLRKVATNVYGFVPLQVTEEQLDSIHGNDECLNIEALPKAVEFYKAMMRK